MDSAVTITGITQQHAPILMRTSYLVECLRACTQVACGPQAARIRLPNPGGEPTLLATALFTISNDGLDVLAETCKHFQKIQLTTQSMGRTLKSLQQSFAKPEERNTHDRHLRRMEQQIIDCTKCGEDFDQSFKAWGKQIREFQTAILGAQAQFVNDVSQQEDKIGRLNDEVTAEQVQLRRVLDKEVEAKQHFQESKDLERGILDDMSVSSVLRYGWTWFWTRGAAHDLKFAQEEVERRRKNAEEYEVNIAEAQIQLARLNNKAADMKRFQLGLTSTLRAIAVLNDNLRSLVVEFQRMGPHMTKLMHMGKDSEDISYDYADSVIPSSERKLFAENIYEMSQLALTVEHMAWSYGGLIENVLISGFQNVSVVDESDSFTTYMPPSTSSSQKQIMGSPNESVCSLVLSEVDTSYSRKGKELRTVHSRVLQDIEDLSKPQRKRSKFSFKR